MTTIYAHSFGAFFRIQNEQKAIELLQAIRDGKPYDLRGFGKVLRNRPRSILRVVREGRICFGTNASDVLVIDVNTLTAGEASDFLEFDFNQQSTQGGV